MSSKASSETELHIQGKKFIVTKLQQKSEWTYNGLWKKIYYMFYFFYTYLVVFFFEEFRMLYITKTALKLQLYIQDQQAL